MAAQTSTRWLPPLTVFLLTFMYIVLLIFFAGPAKFTFTVSRMIKADTCFIDYLGHKSGSDKVVSVPSLTLPISDMSLLIIKF